MASLVSLTVLVFLFTGTGCLQLSGNLPDNNIIHACVGRDITLPWTVQQDNQDTVTNMEWFFDGRSQEMIALSSHDVFLPLPAFSQRVERLSDGTLVLRHVTKEDSGNYSIEVNGLDANRSGVTLRHTIYVKVAENLMTSDHQLHMTQSPRAVFNDVTQEWSLQLSCGNFTYTGQPPLTVEWMSPSGSRYNSSSYGEGHFHWLVPNPVEGSSYTCLVPSRYGDVLCLPPGSSQGLQATVIVDDLKVRMMLMQAEQSSLRIDVGQLTADNQQLAADNQRLAQNVSSLQREVTQLKTDSQLINAWVNDTRHHQVSFHAGMSSNQHLQDNDTVVFATVISNHGNAYDPATGVFTAPYDATYFFIATAGSGSSSHNVYMELVVEGSRVGLAYAHQRNPDVEMATCHAVVQLTLGQRVWLQNKKETYFISADTYFSGFLITN